MEIDLSRVIVSSGATAHTTQVHHRDFPEIRADGGSAKEAASHLANKLTLLSTRPSPTGAARPSARRSLMSRPS